MSSQAEHRKLTARIPDELAGRRLDQALAKMFPEYSRARLQHWIRAGQVLVDAQSVKPRDKVAGGEVVELTATLSEETPWAGEALPLNVVYEDPWLLVLDKPSGVVVHPAAGNRQGTLVNALLHYAPELSAVPRAGIVHRLDKDTSGLMVVARTLEAHKHLVEQLQGRRVQREYLALVYGEMISGGRVDGAIGRHPVDRKRMAVVPAGKPAGTQYRIVERFKGITLIKVILETGRTHQIRVHMAHIHHPVVGDPVYGRLRLPKGASQALIDMLRAFRRQALHAARLSLMHPQSGESMQWQSPLPEDFAALVTQLRRDCGRLPGESDIDSNSD